MSNVDKPDIESKSQVYRFGEFTLDVANRELTSDGERIELNARYFDALALLVRERGRLVGKDRLFEEVWDDVVVSDSALTQCIKEIRRQLGDDASNPRYIQTVPRHGYRFIADVSVQAIDRNPTPSSVDAAPAAVAADRTESEVAISGDRPAVVERRGSEFVAASSLGGRESPLSRALTTAVASTLGGAASGVLGGLLYGIGLAYSPINQELGTASVLLVMISLTGFLGTVGAFGIGAGMAAAEYAAGRRSAWRIVGAALGGMLIGGSVKLLGIDAFNLLFGRTPAGITGGMEGAALGLAVGLATHLGGGIDTRKWWRPVLVAAGTGAAIGVLITVTGGHLLGGSLDLLARSFSESRLQLDSISRYFGEVRFGETTQVILGGLEGLIFTSGVVGALVASRIAEDTPRVQPSLETQ